MPTLVSFTGHALAAAALSALAFMAAAADTRGTAYATGPSTGPLSVSANGRFVLFASYATNLDPSGNHGAQELFLLDSADGRFQRIETHDTDSTRVGYDEDAAVSDDGRYVLYNRWERPPGGGLHVAQVYRLDRATSTTTLVSAFGSGAPGAGDSLAQALSADGRYALLATAAANVGAGEGWIIVRRDLVTGVYETVSVLEQGQLSTAYPGDNDMTPDGRYVSFITHTGLYVRDVATGTTTMASVGLNGAAAGAVAVPMPLAPLRGCNNRTMTPDGRFVLFTTYTGIDPADTTHEIDVYRYDRVTNTSRWVSKAGGASQFGLWSRCASISSDGRQVVYLTSDQDHAEYLFLRDMDAPVSQRLATGYSAEDFGNPTFSSDGTLFFTLSWVAAWGQHRQLVRHVPGGRVVLLTQTSTTTSRQ